MLFGYLEQDKADLDRGFEGHSDQAPWNIAAKHFGVEVKDLLMVESNNLELFPGYNEDVFKEWELFNEEVRNDAKLINRFEIDWGSAELIDIVGERFVRFRDTGFIAFYTV